MEVLRADLGMRPVSWAAEVWVVFCFGFWFGFFWFCFGFWFVFLGVVLVFGLVFFWFCFGF